MKANIPGKSFWIESRITSRRNELKAFEKSIFNRAVPGARSRRYVRAAWVVMYMSLILHLLNFLNYSQIGAIYLIMTSLYRAAEPPPTIIFDGIIDSISPLPTERCWGFVAGVYRHIASPPLGHPSSYRTMLRHRRWWGATQSELSAYINYVSNRLTLRSSISYIRSRLVQ